MKLRLFFIITLGLTMVGLTLPFASGQVVPARPNYRQTETLLIRIETKIDILKEEAQRVANRNPNTGMQDQLGEYLTALEQSVTRLRETVGNRGPIEEDLRLALGDATLIDQFVARNRVTASAQTQWRSLKTDLTSLATLNRISWNWNQPVTPGDVPLPTNTGPAYTVTDRQVQTLLSRIELKTNNYKNQMDLVLRSDTAADRSDDAIVDHIAGLESAEHRLRQRFDSRQSSSVDATEVLTRAVRIDQFMNRNPLNPQAQAQWRNLKADLNTLASYYSVNWNWNQPPPSTTNTGSTGGGGRGMRNFDARLTGTYRLNTSLSEDTSAAIDQALGTTSTAQRESSRRRLEQRLSSPEIIVIEKKGNTVGLASSILPQVTFEADGVARSETNARGRTVTTTATADQDGLIINYQGERASDFYLTFLPMADRRLKVTKQINVDGGSNSITVSSIYDKIDNLARWSAATSSTDGGGSTAATNDAFVIPNGTRLSADLRSDITSSAASDRFTMEVTAGQYRGAVIAGRVVPEAAANRVAGRSRVLLIFDTIRLSSGQTYRFAGTVDSVTAVNGDPVVVTNQTARAASQPPRGTGGILGALIGAISGVPADSTANSATTAGAVLSQNRDSIDIGSGSRVMITASATGVLATPR